MASENTSHASLYQRLPDVIRSFRALSIILAIVIVAMLAVWQPWVPKVVGTNRTISVTGTATITATPDQYVFSPSYSFTNTDKQDALDQLTARSNDLVAQLKKLGVASKDIKTNASGYANYGYYLPVYKGGDTYTLSLTVTVNDAKLAQKVQDYLVTTSPSGEVSPTVSFSTVTEKSLQAQARDKAEKDARAQAEQSAKNLGFSVGSVKSVTDGSLGDGFPIVYNGMAASTDAIAPKSLTVQPGQNDLTYSVQVVYYIQQ